jgi:uncharacterized protein with von Willebrand factor type A (vWA) domain
VQRALTEFVQETRRAGLRVSVAEAMDALRAAAVAGVERERLREALAAAIVKDEADRELFDEVFERFFGGGDANGATRRRAPASAGLGTGRGASGGGTAREPPPEKRDAKGRRPVPARPDDRERPSPALERRRRRRALLARPFRDMDPIEAEELAALAEELARRFRGRLRRRLRRARRGRLDFRRTLRRSVAHGGAAFELELRRRRPGRIDVVALCDVSGSVRHASELFAAMLAPCATLLRSLRLLAFVDRAVPAALVDGRLVPEGDLDLHAFSDLGRALVLLERSDAPPLGRNTVLVVLGDARNNRKPPRADVLGRFRARARAVWWLNPEARDRWGTGDSAIESYRPHVDALLECATPAALIEALDRLPLGR